MLTRKSSPPWLTKFATVLAANPSVAGFWIPRKNFFLGRWIRHGGFYPDPKLRLFRRGAGEFEERLVHEDLRIDGTTATLRHHLLHHAYPTIEDYLEHMNRYSSLGAEMAAAKGVRGFSFVDIVDAAEAHVLLQLFLAPRLSRWPRRVAAAPVPRSNT